MASKLNEPVRIESALHENSAEVTFAPCSSCTNTVPVRYGVPTCTVSDLSGSPRVCVCNHAAVAACCVIVDVPPVSACSSGPMPLVWMSSDTEPSPASVVST